jgi:hypothetical protein
MPDPSKFKSIGIDVDTFNKLKVICNKERRNIRQQIGLMVDIEYEKQDLNSNVKTLGLGTLDRSHS